MKLKIVSLKKNAEFLSVLKGKKIINKYSTIFYKKISNKSSESLNASIIAKKKIFSKAVTRNLVKRRLKSIMLDALKKIDLDLSYSYLFIARKNFFDNEYKNIKESIFKDLSRIR